jgi:cell division protein FtsI (penicillin-binding protein 3)
MKPFVVKKIRHPDGRILLDRRPQEVARPITPETAAVMRRLLLRVTEDGGTARRARVAGYEVAGKTGTAQKPASGGYSSTDYMATFVGFLPARAPEIAMVVTLDNPQPYHQGGVVAAPVFAKIADQAMRYLSIPPEGIATSSEIEDDTILPLED